MEHLGNTYNCHDIGDLFSLGIVHALRMENKSYCH